jgi:hypothetical protein
MQNSIIAEIWVVFAMGSILWIAGFAMQKERNAEESRDYSLRKKGMVEVRLTLSRTLARR